MFLELYNLLKIKEKDCNQDLFRGITNLPYVSFVQKNSFIESKQKVQRNDTITTD